MEDKESERGLRFSFLFFEVNTMSVSDKSRRWVVVSLLVVSAVSSLFIGFIDGGAHGAAAATDAQIAHSVPPYSASSSDLTVVAARLGYSFKRVRHNGGSVEMPGKPAFQVNSDWSSYRSDLRDESYIYSFFRGKSGQSAENAARARIDSIYRGDKISSVQVVEADEDGNYVKLVAEGFKNSTQRNFKAVVLVFQGNHYVLSYSTPPSTYAKYAHEREHFFKSFRFVP